MKRRKKRRNSSMHSWCKLKSGMQHRCDNWNNVNKEQTLKGMETSDRWVAYCRWEWVTISLNELKSKLLCERQERLPLPHMWHTEPVHPFLAASQSPGGTERQHICIIPISILFKEKLIFKIAISYGWGLDKSSYWFSFFYWDNLFLIPNHFHYLSHSMSPSNTIPFLFLFHTRFSLMMIHGWPSWYP